MKKYTLAVLVVLTGLASALSAATSPAFEWIEVQKNAAPGDAINIIISGDGYTSAQRDRFLGDVQLIVNGFNNREPWKTYITHVNFYAAWVVSNQEGISIKDSTTIDTAFKGSIDGTKVVGGLSLDAPTVDAFMAAAPVLGQHVFIVNYVGTRANATGIGGGYAILMRDAATINNQMANRVLHETGHSLVGLSDEYWLNNPSSNLYGKNITADLNAIPWKHWIDAATPLPTPDSLALNNGPVSNAWNLAGAFVRGTTPVSYRPTWTSIMAGGGEFGPVNSEATVLAIYAKTGPLLTVAPFAGRVVVRKSQEQTFAPQKWAAPTTVTTKWYVNDALYAQTDTLTLKGSDLAAGIYTVKVVLKDETSFVRSDPNKLTEDTVTWTVTLGNIPIILTQPSNASITAGQSSTFSVTADGAGETLSYSWRKDGQAIAGATGSSYTTGTAGQYSVVVTNASGSTTSDSATLTVQPASNTGSGSGGGGGAPNVWFFVLLALTATIKYIQKWGRK